MIVIDDAASPDFKSPAGALQLPLPATAPGRSAPLPYARGLPEAAPLQYPHDVPAHVRRSFPRGERARPRFLKAFAAAVGVWFLLCILAGSFTDVASSSARAYSSFGGSVRIGTSSVLRRQLMQILRKRKQNTRTLLVETSDVPAVL
ncbi:hypothetical protein DFH11DRAFT_90533 [Phellopilus nigrolimitatus]|nr:hypothetical protein DFH11DRAFT_90533 [Phellopilus nigrolimitatus]